MAETGKLGIADSLLANVQLAFAAAEAAPPAITTQDGRLGWQLGSTALGVNGVIGPLVIHPSAESVLALAQTADPAPTFVAHATPHWTLGGHDAQLGAMESDFTGADAPLPTPTVQDGRLGKPLLGNTVLGLDGVIGPRTICMAAESALAIAQAADPAPTFVAHASRHWVLGAHDAVLGGMELAYAGAPDLGPLTGSLTGKLGTTYSLLGGMRPALGEQEGSSQGAIKYADATSELSLLVAANTAIARAKAATSIVNLTDAAGRNDLLGVSAESPIGLSDAAGRNNLLGATAESTLSLDTMAASTVAWAAAALSGIALTDAAGRNYLLTAAAESAVGLNGSAGAAVVRVLAAESVLELTDAAANTGRTIYTVSGESALGLTAAASTAVARALAASDELDLTGAAGRNNISAATAESTINLTDAAGRNSFPVTSAVSTLSLTDTAGRNNFLAAAAESTLSLQSTAVQVGRLLAAAATSELSLVDEAACAKVTVHQGEVWDFLPLVDVASVTVVRNLAAQNTIALSHAERTARPWYLSAETPLQTVGYEYDQATDTFYPVYEGLKDWASTARPLTAAAHQSIPLAQSASAVRVKPNAINVSAENVLELLGEVRMSPTGAAGDWLTLGQTATVDKCKLVRSRLDLAQEAAVLVSVPRGAASALGLSQAATYSIVSRGTLQGYTPFVGEGAFGSPTPPAVTIGPPEHVALPFQLFYPAEGIVTDSVTLRAPNLGNKDRLSFNRILRETRGGTLIVFADPIWPKIQTLVLTFSGLRSTQAQQLLAFLETHLGEEIGLLDWEGRAWKGVVMTPIEPVVQDGRDSYSASMEFEGEMIPV